MTETPIDFHAIINRTPRGVYDYEALIYRGAPHERESYGPRVMRLTADTLWGIRRKARRELKRLRSGSGQVQRIETIV